MIVTCGPTGSGKTTLASETAKLLNINDYVVLLVDDIIENNPEYKKKIEKILEESFPGKNCVQEGCLNNPPPEVYAKFADAYFSTRKTPNKGCDDMKCDDYFDKKLQNAIAAKKNIVLESTCGYYPKWLLDETMTPKDYTIVFSYSLVSLCNLIKRNSKRAQEQLTTYMQDKQKNPAPRLPDVRYDTIKKTVEGIRDILLTRVLSCSIKQGQECVRDIRVIIFDNNSAKMNRIYDSQTESDTSSIVETVKNKLATDETCPIGGRKKRKTIRKRRFQKLKYTNRR